MRIGLLGAGRIGAFHAGTLAAHPDVTELLIADADPERARQVAAGSASAHGVSGRGPSGPGASGPGASGPGPSGQGAGRQVVSAVTVDRLFESRPDAVVIASATAAHAGLITRAARAGIPAFCEKPVAVDLAGTVAALDTVAKTGALLQVGFQRRFDAGYAAAREALRAGRVGRLHTVRTVSSDAAPPPAAYVPLSGGLYRDCLIHDFDIVRWVTGREVTEVYAVGTNEGDDFFRAAGDADTAAALLTLEGGVLATATATRYHAAGYDVRMELAGTTDQLVVGVGPRAPLTSVEPADGWDGETDREADREAGGGGGAAGVGGREAVLETGQGAGSVEPPGRTGPATGSGADAAACTRWPGFLERFAPAYRAELGAFLRVVRGELPNPCEGREALRALLVAEACELSRRERRPVAVAEVEAAAHACAAELNGVVV